MLATANTSTPSQFDQDYYLNGIATGKSNYVNYGWCPSLTLPACAKIAEYLGLRRGDSIIDVGCARGYMVRAFRELGYRAYGQDTSVWAIENCDSQALGYVSTDFHNRAFDWAISKDTLEHVPEPELSKLVSHLNETISKGMLFIVPLTLTRGGKYLRDEDEMDVTHVNRWTLDDWISFFEEHAPGFNVNASYLIHGIKPAAAQVKHSCGFFTLIRP